MDSHERRMHLKTELGLLSGRNPLEDGFMESWKIIGGFKSETYDRCVCGQGIKNIYVISDGTHFFNIGSECQNMFEWGLPSQLKSSKELKLILLKSTKIRLWQKNQ